jgi:hypothetical protein
VEDYGFQDRYVLCADMADATSLLSYSLVLIVASLRTCGFT